MRLWVTKPGKGKTDKGADVAAGGFGIALLVLAWSYINYPLVWRENNLVFIPRSLLIASFILSAVGAAVVLSVPFLQRTSVNWSRRIAAPLWVLIIGSLLIPGVVLLLNGLLDTSRPIAHDVQVIEWRRTLGRGGSSSVLVRVKDWKQPTGEITLDFVGNMGKGIEYNAPAIKVVTKKGFFGYEWYVSLQPTEVVASGQPNN